MYSLNLLELQSRHRILGLCVYH